MDLNFLSFKLKYSLINSPFLIQVFSILYTKTINETAETDHSFGHPDGFL
jgi:hypothetical protein